MERIQTLVIGAGVVGLACARRLALSGRQVVIAEAGETIGEGTSSRNSEVVHAGIYYKEGSRKAKHCVRGAKELIDFCVERKIAHKVCGKLIVATHENQHGVLAKLAESAAKNGVHLRPMSVADAKVLEPEVVCTSALHSPLTAIVDSHGLMTALLADAEAAGAILALRTKILTGGWLLPGGGAVVRAAVVEKGEILDEFDFTANEVVNCAGLGASRVASAIGVPLDQIPDTKFCKGSYYSLHGAGRPFNGLVYPVPEENTSGLGVHASIDLAGNARFGPDVEWLPNELPNGQDVGASACSNDTTLFKVDPARSSCFYAAVRRYWPGLPDGSLQPDYCGIRPKLAGPGEPAADFAVRRSGPTVIGLFGIESPGLTSAMSLATEVVERLSNNR